MYVCMYVCMYACKWPFLSFVWVSIFTQAFEIGAIIFEIYYLFILLFLAILFLDDIFNSPIPP
jgi:hypothetical protein